MIHPNTCPWFAGVLFLMPTLGSAADGDFWPKSSLTLGQASTILSRSDDRRKLEQACLTLARSTDKEALARLAEHLNDPAFWVRLDDPEKYRVHGAHLRLRRVLHALAQNGSESAEAVLVTLFDNQEFLSHSLRFEALVLSIAEIPSPSARVLAALESIPERSGYRPIKVAQALICIGSPAALKILEDRLLDENYPAVSRGGWCIYFLMTYRLRPEVVDLYGRVLRSNELKDNEMVDRVVQSLFDYRPDEWYGEVESRTKWKGPPAEPPLKDASTEALQKLRDLTDVAVKLSIQPDTKLAVEKSRKAIDALLAQRVKEKK